MIFLPNKYLLLFTTFIYLGFSWGCSNAVKKQIPLALQDSSVYANQNYTELILDSVFVASLINKDRTIDSFSQQIMEFYTRRGFQAAWFVEGNLGVQALNFFLRLKEDEFNKIDSLDLIAILKVMEDTSYIESADAVSKGIDKPFIDVLLTISFFKYAKAEYYGLDKTAHDLEWYIPRKKKDYVKLLDALIKSDEEYAIYEPVNPYYTSLKGALLKYKTVEKNGGFPFVDSALLAIKVGEENTAISQLKNHLFVVGDYTENDTSALFTDSLYTAIKSYQKRMGLSVNGKIDRATLVELNTPIRERIMKIMVNLERLRWLPAEEGDNYLLVNIPAFKLYVFEQKKYQWSMDVVVGQAATATTIFSDKMKYVVFSPYWNVPQSIIRNELLPKLKKNSNYLNSKNMEVVQNGKVINSRAINWHNYSKGVPFTIREKPGKNNSLGLVKFLFPNQFSIYMHDTPAKSLFDRKDRAFSHGCIRLSDPEKLAAYVLRNDTTYTPEKIRELMNKGEEKWVTINPSLPVYIVYFSTWVSHDGKLNFRKDIYGADAKLATEVFGM